MRVENMKTKIVTIAILTIFLIVSLCGCSDEEDRSSSQSSNSSNETSSPVSLGMSGSTGPEYLYEEFINNEEPDTSMLGKEEGTQEEAEQLSSDIKMIEDRLTGLDQTYKEDGKIELEQVDSYLAEVAVVLENMYENNEIADFDYGAGCLEVTLNSGVAYIISPEVKDCDAGGSGTKIKIATYQPFRTASIEEKYPVERLDRLDEGARLISDSMEQYEFFQDGSSTDYDLEDEEVTLESVLKFQNYNVVLWHGHGDYTKSKGSLLLLGVKCSEENNIKYMKDLREGRLVCDGGYYAVTSTFIDTYIPDGALKNHIIYLGTCHSGQDERLAQSFLNKGAMAVYANSGIIYRDYNLSMIYSVAEGLTRQADDGSYYTTEMALDYAQEINGEYDGNGTETKLYVDPDAEAVSLDWYQDYVRAERDVVVVLDESGSMQGEPLDETKEAASKFVDTVLEKNSRVAMIPYSSSADLQNDFSRRKTVLKTNIGDLQAFGQTNTYSAVEMADQVLDASSAKTKIMLVMTDGMPNLGTALNGSYEDALVQYCQQMKQKGYYIYTLGFFSYLNETEKSIPQNMLQDMASPGCHYEVKDAGDLVYFFDDIAQQISGQNYVYIRIACPVDVTVSRDGETLSSSEEEKNTRTSFGSLTFEGDMDEIKVLRLKSDEIYDIDIHGTGDGTMDYMISYMDENGQYTDQRTFSAIPVTSETEIDSDTDGSGKTVLELDSDGDGEVDKTYEAGAGEEGVEVEPKNPWVLYGSIGGGAAALAGIIIICIVVHRKKKKKGSEGPKQPAFQPALLCIQGEYQGGVFAVPVSTTVSIGRDKSCNIILNHQKVSRLHCIVYAAPEGGYQVMDYSSNGTYVNGALIQKNIPFHACSGQCVAIGRSGNVFQLN